MRRPTRTSSAARATWRSSQWLAPEGLNVYDILRHDTLVLTKDAAQAVTEALKPKAKEASHA